MINSNRLFAFVLILFFTSCSTKKITLKNELSSYAFRLKPNQDLKKSIDSIVLLHNIKAGWISTCVGSLVTYNIRFANQPTGTIGNGHFEIVSLVGTLSTNGSHIHISVSDSTGKTIGGHLQEGCNIYTTAEIVIQATDKYSFERKEDGTTPWKELQVIENKK
jgi:uncharacterized protein